MMRIKEIIPEAYVGQASPVGSVKEKPSKRVKAKKKIEGLFKEGRKDK
jgi:hypothetical protein